MEVFVLTKSGSDCCVFPRDIRLRQILIISRRGRKGDLYCNMVRTKANAKNEPIRHSSFCYYNKHLFHFLFLSLFLQYIKK